MAVDAAEHSTIADISIQSEQFEFGRVLSDDFELERVVPLGGQAMIPLVWLREGGPDNFETEMREHPNTRSIRRLTHLNGALC
ncbi:hypothetical protein [Halomicrococcus sp. NG-SE-24]|uniref:hypothetical protein n=1 Tax=Halomicrococcus sp. NG-SE-24 TaxID=3436928 RepID=UPI003D9751F3